MVGIRIDTHTLRVPEGERFEVSVKHYALYEKLLPSKREQTVKSVTAVLAHGIGQHKELFEPFLSDLIDIQNRCGRTTKAVVTEAYAMDCANHGDSAILNERRLVSNNNRFTSPLDYAHSLVALMDSGLIRDMESKTIVLIGFSGGAVAAVLAANEFIKRKEPLPFSSLVLLEVSLIETPKENFQQKNEYWLNNITPNYSKLLNAKQDRWPTKEAALDYLRKRSPYKTWDRRCLNIFIEHGLRPLPTLFYPDDKIGVTPKCFKGHEAQGFGTNWPAVLMTEALPGLCEVIDIHLIFGGRSALRPSNEELKLLAARNDDIYPCNKYASVFLIPEAGHHLAQDAPRETAKCVFNILNENKEGDCAVSKL